MNSQTPKPTKARATSSQATFDKLARSLEVAGFKDPVTFLTQDMKDTVLQLTGWKESTFKTFLSYAGKPNDKLLAGFRDYIPTPMEVKMIQTHMPRGFGIVLHYLGCRFSEMWELEYDPATLYETGSLFDDYLIVPGKKGSNRVRISTADMPGHITYAVKEWITNKLSQSTIRRLWYDLRDRGLISHKLTPHSFRHALISELILNGTPIAEVASTIGHRDVRSTYRYLHQSPARQAAIRNTRPSVLEELYQDELQP